MKVAYIFLTLFIALLSGILPVIHKHLLKKINPMSLLIFSGATYATVLFLFSFSQMDNVKKDFMKLTPTDALWIGVSSIVCVFLSNILYYNILEKHKSYLVSTLIDIAPLFTLIFAFFFLNERITKLGVLGIFFVISGVFLISLSDLSLGEFKLER